jgi:hypothetical protein
LEKFSRNWSVASRDSLYQILDSFVALRVWQRAKSGSPPSLCLSRRGFAGEIATANFGEFLFPRRSVNKAKKKGWGSRENPNPRWVLVISQPVLWISACIWS